MNDNGVRLVSFCTEHKLVIGGTLCGLKETKAVILSNTIQISIVLTNPTVIFPMVEVTLM